MNDILQKNELNVLNDKNKKFALITLLVVLVLLLIKFLLMYDTYVVFYSNFTSEHSVSYAIQDSILSGIIMSIGSIISFILFNYKKYTASFIINSLLIIIYFTFPYIYYSLV